MISPTNILSYLRLLAYTALVIYALIKLWGEWLPNDAVTILAVAAVIDKIFGVAESKMTADNKDVEKVNDRVNTVVDKLL